MRKSLTNGNSTKLGSMFGSGSTDGSSHSLLSHGHDLCIADQANQNEDSYSNVNRSYHNANYKMGDEKSWERFCGNPNGYNFKVVEWEVWQVEFA